MSSETVPAATEMKTCPDCAEQVQAAARVCRFCGHWFVLEPANGADGIAAGWYPDPSDEAEQRYWDGEQWTTHLAPGRVYYPQQPDDGRYSRLYALGLVTAVLLPLIGFVLGILLLTRGQRPAGLVVVAVSIAVSIVAYVVLSNSL